MTYSNMAYKYTDLNVLTAYWILGHLSVKIICTQMISETSLIAYKLSSS